MTVEVIRAFDGHQAGEIVDASGWKWTEQLIEQRYVRPVYGSVKRKKAAAEDASLAADGPEA